MITTKAGVDLSGVRPEMIYALLVADGVFASFGKDLIVTSVGDGKHGRGSLHYVGLAVDLRRNHLTDAEAGQIRDQTSKCLGRQYDVVLEETHLHIEFQPK